MYRNLDISSILIGSTILIVLSGILFACKENKPAHHHLNSAQKHMHSYSTDKLIRLFDDPTRDEWQKPREVIRFLNLSPGAVIADLGAGSGYFSLRLARAGYRVIALDIDKEFIAHLEQKSTGLKRENPKGSLETRLIEPGKTGLMPNEVDVILTVNTYHHFDDRLTFLKKMKEALKPGGQLVVIDFKDGELPVGPKPDHKIQESQMIEEISDAGFYVTENIELLPYQVILIGRSE